jgi:hypothetical protein
MASDREDRGGHVWRIPGRLPLDRRHHVMRGGNRAATTVRIGKAEMGPGDRALARQEVGHVALPEER